MGDIEGFVQKIPGIYKKEQPINITAKDIIHLKRHVFNGGIVHSIREPKLLSFGLQNPPGRKLMKTRVIYFFKKIKKFVLSHTTFCLEDNDAKPIDFNRETINFTCHCIQNTFFKSANHPGLLLLTLNEPRYI